jgi:copper chaperone CopZ
MVAFITGIFAGALVNLVEVEQNTLITSEPTDQSNEKKGNIIWRIINYALVELIGDVGRWVVTGILFGGIFAAVIPSDLITTWFSSPWTAYPLMLIAGIPLYVCATGSIPIAAAFVLKGISPGAALVFLTVGPATNTATLSFVGGTLGKRTLFAYLGAIIISAVLGGLLLDFVWPFFTPPDFLQAGASHHQYNLLHYSSAVILIGAVLWSYRPLKKLKKEDPVEQIKVSKITCEGCASSVKKGLSSLAGVTGVAVDVETKIVTVSGSATVDALRRQLLKINYPAD